MRFEPRKRYVLVVTDCFDTSYYDATNHDSYLGSCLRILEHFVNDCEYLTSEAELHQRAVEVIAAGDVLAARHLLFDIDWGSEVKVDLRELI